MSFMRSNPRFLNTVLLGGLLRRNLMLLQKLDLMGLKYGNKMLKKR